MKHFLPKAIEESSLLLGLKSFVFVMTLSMVKWYFVTTQHALLDGSIFHVWDCNSHLRVHGTVLNVMEHCNVHVYVHNCNRMTACMHACLQCTQLYQFT